jgi:hypothetical protein
MIEFTFDMGFAVVNSFVVVVAVGRLIGYYYEKTLPLIL